ncbi:MAG: NUDIX hydrolase [Limisphaerales bacterium]
MNEDIFDVVNEHDEIIGRELRSVVHTRGLRHRAVHVLVFNAAGQLFLQKRSMAKDNDPGLWDSSCSGHVDSGESYAVAAERELMEEIDLLVDEPMEELFKIEASAGTGFEFAVIYRTESEGPFTLCPEEIDEGRWFTPEEINNALASEPEKFSPTFKIVWGRL